MNCEMQDAGMHFSESQMRDLCGALTQQDDGGVECIFYDDFFNSFEVVDAKNTAASVRVGFRHNKANE